MAASILRTQFLAYWNTSLVASGISSLTFAADTARGYLSESFAGPNRMIRVAVVTASGIETSSLWVSVHNLGAIIGDRLANAALGTTIVAVYADETGDARFTAQRVA